VPFCRDCGFEVQEDWVACPKCGELSSPISSRANTTKEIQHRNSKEKPTKSKTVVYVIIGLMLFLIIYPGEGNVSLLEWADETCRIQPSQTGNPELDSIIDASVTGYQDYCMKKKASFFFYVIILIACILYLSVDDKKTQEKKSKKENEKKNIALEEKNIVEEAKKLRKNKQRKKANKRWAVREKSRQNNPLRYYSILTIKAIIVIAIGTVIVLQGGFGQRWDGKTLTNNYGNWVLEINDVPIDNRSNSSWSGEIEVDGQSHSINGQGNSFSSYEGKRMFVQITRVDGESLDLFCVKLTGPDYRYDERCTSEKNGEIILPEQKPTGLTLNVGIIVGTITMCWFIIIEKRDRRRRYHLREVSNGVVANTEVVDSQQNEETVDLLETVSDDESPGEYEQSGDGYWYLKKNDGTFEPTAHVKAEGGSFTPYSE